MRTKVLCAAALAAGALTSMAQVYSANIVGYCNVATPVGYNFLSNPLDGTPDNKALTIIPNVNPDPTGNSGQLGPWDGSTIQEWNGSSWIVSAFDSLTDDTTTGFTDLAGTHAVPQPVLSSGKGFLLNNQSALTSITFVGQVRTGTNTLAMPPRLAAYAVGSMLPVSGGISSSVGFTNPNPDRSGNTTLGPIDGCYFESLRVNGSGGFSGYTVSAFDSLTDDSSTGFTDQAGTHAVPEPQVAIGQGFFFVNSSSATYNFQQILNP